MTPPARHSEGFTIDELQELTTVFMEQQSAPRHPRIQMLIRWQHQAVFKNRGRRAFLEDALNLYGHLVCQIFVIQNFQHLFAGCSDECKVNWWEAGVANGAKPATRAVLFFLCFRLYYLMLSKYVRWWTYLGIVSKASQRVCTKQICYYVRNTCVII